MNVTKLPANIQSQLRSDLVATSISNCVIELVENAIDANSTCIAVRINLETFRLEVLDNGEGLTKKQLEFVGERYCTSRNEDSSFRRFGYRGESLASIKNVSSRLLIVSRASGEDTTYCKQFEGHSAGIAKAVHQRASRGTTIIVENVLGNISVRQRCTKSRVELQTIKRYIQATALMFPGVNFSVRDDIKKCDIVQIRRTKSTRTTFMTLFPGAVRERSSLLNLTSKHENLTIKAMISKEMCSTDQLQFIFINKRYIPNCEIQEYLNQLLNKIDTSKERRASKVAYVLNLSCPRDEYEMTFEPGKRLVELNQWSKVKRCLLGLVKQLTNDESVLDEKIPVKKEAELVSKDAFRKLNTAHTVFGVPANRAKNQTESPEVHVIDDSFSDSSQSVSLLKNVSPARCKAEITDVRVEEKKTKVSRSLELLNKGRRTAKKNQKDFRSNPRLCDQGAKLEYKKSPLKKIRPGVENRMHDTKTCSKNINAIVDESASSEYAWIWKQTAKKAHDIDVSKRPEMEKVQNKSVAGLKDKCRRRAPEKVEKYKKLNKDGKYMERCKSMEALSRRPMVQKSGVGRISKKNNNYFDANPLEKNDLISRYGNVRKNVEQHEKIDGMVRPSDLETEKTWEIDDLNPNLEWTATLTEQGNEGVPRMMVFDDRRSLELECFNDADDCIMVPTQLVDDESSKNISLSLNRINKCFNGNEKNTNLESFELIPILPGSDNESKNSMPLKRVSKRLNFDEKKDEIENERRIDSFKFEDSQAPKKPIEIIKNYTNFEVIGYKQKVSEWISKIPSNDNLEIVEDSYDSLKIIPTKHSREDDQMANDFETKAKISRTENEFNYSTPEKSTVLKFDNFKLENKWKLGTSKSRMQKYMIQSKVRHRPNTRSPKLLFNWNVKAGSNKNHIDDILDGAINRENENDRNENSKQSDQLVDKSNKDSKLTEKGSWNCVDDCNQFKTNDSGEVNEVLNDIQNIVHSSQKSSSCSSDCKCKCHRSSHSTNRVLTNSIENDRKSGTHNSVVYVPNDTTILKNTASCPATDNINDISMASNHNQINEEMSQGKEIDEEEIPAKLEVASQHFSSRSDNPEDSKYFSTRSELAEKLKFKMKSKFLESSSAVDIPRGMLQVRRTATNVEKLSSDEKKAVEELVKPYSMQKHITVDDYGNSCLRIFPFLKKNNEKLENTEDPLNCDVMFIKSDICSFEFLAQVNDEFILAKAELQSTKIPLLILLDQHAVDERIRVERLLKEYTRDSRWLSSSINPPIHLSVPFNYSSLFTDYQSNFEQFGLFYEFNSVNRNNEEKLIISCNLVPTCLYNKAKRESANNYHPILKRLIEKLIKEVLKKFTTQETWLCITSSELQNVVNDEACRGAVKFGDALSPQLCKALLEGLKFCDFPFQCAHGRPSVIPLTNLNLLTLFTKEIPELSLDKMKSAFGP